MSGLLPSPHLPSFVFSRMHQNIENTGLSGQKRPIEYKERTPPTREPSETIESIFEPRSIPIYEGGEEDGTTNANGNGIRGDPKEGGEPGTSYGRDKLPTEPTSSDPTLQLGVSNPIQSNSNAFPKVPLGFARRLDNEPSDNSFIGLPGDSRAEYDPSVGTPRGGAITPLSRGPDTEVPFENSLSELSRPEQHTPSKDGVVSAFQFPKETKEEVIKKHQKALRQRKSRQSVTQEDAPKKVGKGFAGS